jgi:hypothetical protein
MIRRKRAISKYRYRSSTSRSPRTSLSQHSLLTITTTTPRHNIPFRIQPPSNNLHPTSPRTHIDLSPPPLRLPHLPLTFFLPLLLQFLLVFPRFLQELLKVVHFLPRLALARRRRHRRYDFRRLFLVEGCVRVLRICGGDAQRLLLSGGAF